MTTAKIVHRIPGRIRMRISDKRSDAPYFASLSEHLVGIQGVRAARANASTRSVVVHYDGDLDLLLQRMQEQISGFVIEKEHRIKHSLSIGSLGTQPYRLVSGRQLTPMFMLGTAFTAVGVIQTFRGKIAVPSITALWYALESFRQSVKRGS